MTSTMRDAMHARLAEAQDSSGGIAHEVTYDSNDDVIVGSPTPPTGEATAIAIMAHTVNVAP